MKEDVLRAQPILEQAGALLAIPLKVSAAFHSPYMCSAQKQFESFLKNFKFSSPELPVFSNRTAELYKASEIAQNLALQITHPVRWVETIKNLMAQHLNEFQEIGPGNVLTGLVKRIKNGQ